MEENMFTGRRQWFGPNEPVFQRGDIKYMVLELLKDKPRHGYEIIRELEERSFGFYSPSPGTVYPTLQWLEEMSYVSSVEKDGKKIYTITESGARFHEENKTGRTGFGRPPFSGWDHVSGFEFHDTMHSLREIGRMLAQSARSISSEKLKRINAIIKRTYDEVIEIIRQPDLKSSQ
jgi:DNA-binding PadR family transcriptional regulator